MVKLKNYNAVLKVFVLFLTFILTTSCSEKTLYVSRIEGKEIGVTDKSGSVAKIENFITPYREKIDTDLNTVLAFAPETLDKSGKWQSAIGDLFADVTLKMGSPIFFIREKENIDFVLLNSGGIRSIIPKGAITTRTAFEIMPFENELVVVAMKSEQILEMIQYIISEKKPHPLSGLTFTIDKNGEPKNICIQGKPMENGKTYYAGTNDYLYNGGDNMLFFKKGSFKYTLDYKLRNVLIDYFKEVDTVKITKDVRISVQN